MNLCPPDHDELSRTSNIPIVVHEQENKHIGKVQFLFETDEEVVDVDEGRLAAKTVGRGDAVERRFDLIVAWDGAGSMI